MSPAAMSALDVLFVSHMGTYWGAERSLVTLLGALDRTAIRPLVSVPARGALTDALDHRSIPYVVTHHTGWLGRRNNVAKRLLRTLWNVAAYALACRSLRGIPIDLVYSNTLYSPMGALIARRLGVPHIWHARELVHEDMNATFDFGTPRSMRFIDDSATAVVCNSEAVMRKLSRTIPESKSKVVYNGFPGLDREPATTLRRRGPSPGPLSLALVGRVEPAKGQLEAVRALRHLLDEGSDARLTLVGTGDWSYGRRVRRTVRKLGVAGRVTWRGFVRDAEEIYRSSDIVLVCSRAEAFGRVAVEAMSAGCPVVGTNSGGLPEIIVDGANGLLYRPGDHRTLARCIQRLVSEPNLYRSISEGALSSVYGRFTITRYAEAVQAIIAGVHEGAGEVAPSLASKKK